ncbi:exported hypothetical protein [Candidatus Sulfotelmatomonas gaucii]|uniref:Uncharacterized protein n=1 Tax=Candidatus Sulfuritelmatomonas gaucii TaxID=2043161 RepID=A0A2N9LC77_9BACT|nr:exported hypothetical protein [Candidatus Sulfotelmatomonas gaucii]
MRRRLRPPRQASSHKSHKNPWCTRTPHSRRLHSNSLPSFVLIFYCIQSDGSGALEVYECSAAGLDCGAAKVLVDELTGKVTRRLQSGSHHVNS